MLTIETEFVKVIKVLKPTAIESFETVDSIFYEFCSMLIAAGYNQRSVDEVILEAASLIEMSNPPIHEDSEI